MQKDAIYARVSDAKLTEAGERRQDIQRQVDRLKPYAGRSALVFRDDDKSAFKEDYNSRPEFCRLMREIRANRIRKVYVESLDRWSRRIADGMRTLGEVSEHNATVISIQEGEIDVTSSAGWLKTGIFLLMAEWASRDKSDKIRNALDRRRNDKRKLCHSCGVVHMGRHPNSCRCKRCIRKGRSRTSGNPKVSR
jgi:DNA invertase Pin-like site-specific DNA recombinase